ncbi:hypothetical protein D9M71_306550 [compost metagenome]
MGQPRDDLGALVKPGGGLGVVVNKRCQMGEADEVRAIGCWKIQAQAVRGDLELFPQQVA